MNVNDLIQRTLNCIFNADVQLNTSTKPDLKTTMGIKLLADKVDVMTEFLREGNKYKVDEQSFYAVIWNSLFMWLPKAAG